MPLHLAFEASSNASFFWFYFWIIGGAAAAIVVTPFIFELPPDPGRPRRGTTFIRNTGRRLAAFLLRGR